MSIFLGIGITIIIIHVDPKSCSCAYPHILVENTLTVLRWVSMDRSLARPGNRLALNTTPCEGQLAPRNAALAVVWLFGIERIQLLMQLTESDVITSEHVEKLQNITRTDTTKAAVLHLITEALPERGPNAFKLFLKALRGSQQKHVAEQLEKWLRDPNDCPGHPGTFERLQYELRTYYEDKMEFVYTMPWLPTERFSLKKTFVQRRLRLTNGDREEDTQLLNSRTALYTSIHNITKRKANERMHLTPAEVEESLLRPLYRLAFEANQKNETVICESEFKNAEQFEQVCQVGYLSKELIISHNQAETRFSFTHKTFLEFLTAKHMMDPQERLARIHDLHYADYRIRVKAVEDKFNVRHNEPVLGFLFGLLEENPKEISFLKRDQP
ncbi:hypothetical protein CAPTEDRAFT_207193 [Capitella teleta]|uniref:CARD domain-containing protein n=1 Tax=Capitella teleta TaxID=283909 RepID=R7T6V0_CAPTE|nr:hypothetical protein CAPTEDRAFT_207193 [Capitella teleta]|eukprot:ELT89319.1 hypothetical protein CAPTEDRAFT_207193 [Capitella teleta]